MWFGVVLCGVSRQTKGITWASEGPCTRLVDRNEWMTQHNCGNALVMLGSRCLPLDNVRHADRFGGHHHNARAVSAVVLQRHLAAHGDRLETSNTIPSQGNAARSVLLMWGILLAAI